MHMKSEGQRFKTVGTFTPVRWDTAVFGANSMAETCLRRQHDFFFKHERTLSELAAAKVENVRLGARHVEADLHGAACGEFSNETYRGVTVCFWYYVCGLGF